MFLEINCLWCEWTELRSYGFNIEKIFRFCFGGLRRGIYEKKKIILLVGSRAAWEKSIQTKMFFERN